jgi:hypothetical protein
MMSELAREAPGSKDSEVWTSLEVISCKVCGKTEAIMRCGRCRVVGYWADWGVHKKICVPKRGSSS